MYRNIFINNQANMAKNTIKPSIPTLKNFSIEVQNNRFSSICNDNCIIKYCFSSTIEAHIN